MYWWDVRFGSSFPLQRPQLGTGCWSLPGAKGERTLLYAQSRPGTDMPPGLLPHRPRRFDGRRAEWSSSPHRPQGTGSHRDAVAQSRPRVETRYARVFSRYV